MTTRYAITLHGNICRIVKTLQDAMASMSYHPWRGGQIFEIEYSRLTSLPVNAKLVA